MKTETLSLKTIINELNFLWKTVFFNEIEKKNVQLFVTKLKEKITDPHNAKEYYQSSAGNKNTESIKQSKINTKQPKSFENLQIVDINSVTTEHPKNSHKLKKTIRQAKKLGTNSSLYSDTKKVKIFWTNKM